MSDEEWCVLSETRLFKKILHHKPAGVAKHFHLAFLIDYMNNVYEDEDTEFEDLLDEESLKILESRKDMHEISEPLVFQPKYRIRPGAKQIIAKLKELYDMERVEENEYVPEELFEERDFTLPDEYASLMKKREEQNRSSQSCFVTPSSINRQFGGRRRRRDSGETQSSRSSTPASKDRKRL